MPLGMGVTGTPALGRFVSTRIISKLGGTASNKTYSANGLRSVRDDGIDINTTWLYTAVEEGTLFIVVR